MSWDVIYYKELVKLSPVPVKFTDTVKIGYDGTFWSKIYNENQPSTSDFIPYIEIAKRLKSFEKLSVLIHEISHAKCHKKNCNCIKNPDYTQREIHAFKFQLKWLLKHKQKKALKYAIKVTEGALNRNDYYLEVAKHIMKLKLWEKCLKYTKEIK